MLQRFQLDDHDVEALTGAGETSFQLADYAKASHYLKMSLEVSPKSQTRLATFSRSGPRGWCWPKTHWFHIFPPGGTAEPTGVRL